MDRSRFAQMMPRSSLGGKLRRRLAAGCHIESRFESGDPVCAWGEATLDEETGDRLSLGRPENVDHPFLLSAYEENYVLRRGGRKASMILTVTFGAALLAGPMLFGAFGSFTPASYLAAALVAPIVMAIVAVVLHFNDLIFLRDRARRNHSNIDVALKKRADLIPRLKAAASGLMAHEQEVQTHLASCGLNQNPRLIGEVMMRSCR